MRENWPQLPKFFEVEIANYGQVISAMDGCDAVISLASRPSAANYTEEDVFVTNVSSMWNVCRAAEQLKISKVVLWVLLQCSRRYGHRRSVGAQRGQAA